MPCFSGWASIASLASLQSIDLKGPIQFRVLYNLGIFFNVWGRGYQQPWPYLQLRLFIYSF